MKLKISDARAWYLWMAAGFLVGLALAINVKPPARYHGTAFSGCAPTYCVV